MKQRSSNHTTHTLSILKMISIIALLFASFSFSANAVKCNKADRAALLAFKDSFPNNKHDSFYYSYPDWEANSTTDCCSWNYIECDTTGRVTSFVLTGVSDDPPPTVNLSGPIPAVLGELTALKTIQFEYMPGLVGPIPPQIAKLKNLQTLVVSKCQINGSIPSVISQLPSLQSIDLSKNKLVGTIPPSLADLVNLSSLSLHDNQLTGIIPTNLFGKLSKNSNVFLYLSTNKLKGRIPKSFHDVNFFACYLDDNKLEGDLSPLFGRNKTISYITMYSNNFSFDLTNVEYPMALTYLDIGRNEIYGSISNQITELPSLTTAVFMYNNLCGKIPSGGHFQNFPAVFFEHNKCLCGAPLKSCN